MASMATIESTKRCYKCGEPKALSEFYKDARTPTGRKYECKACFTAMGKVWTKRNGQHLAAYQRERRHIRRDAKRAAYSEMVASRTHKECRQCGQSKPIGEFHPDKKAKDRLRYECKECARTNSKTPEAKVAMLERSRRWKAANRERLNAIQRLRYVPHPRPKKDQATPRVRVKTTPRLIRRISGDGGSPALVYRVTNLKNGKAYIGITRRNVALRWKEHRVAAHNGSKDAIHCAIRKYGETSFAVEILYQTVDSREAVAVEAGLIAQYGTCRPGGYNLTSGGEGGAISNIGRRFTMPRDAVDRSAAKRRGQKRTPEMLARMSEARKGKGLLNRAAAKLTAEQVSQVKAALLRGYAQSELAVVYGVTQCCISNIKTGKRWAEITASVELT